MKLSIIYQQHVLSKSHFIKYPLWSTLSFPLWRTLCYTIMLAKLSFSPFNVHYCWVLRQAFNKKSSLILMGISFFVCSSIISMQSFMIDLLLLILFFFSEWSWIFSRFYGLLYVLVRKQFVVQIEQSSKNVMNYQFLSRNI